MCFLKVGFFFFRGPDEVFGDEGWFFFFFFDAPDRTKRLLDIASGRIGMPTMVAKGGTTSNFTAISSSWAADRCY